MDEYIEALHTVLEPQMEAVKPYVITAAAGWRTCPGTGRLEWMVEGLKYRDKWESKLLRTADWSPMK